MKKIKIQGHNVTIYYFNTIRIDWKNGKLPKNKEKLSESIYEYLVKEGFIE